MKMKMINLEGKEAGGKRHRVKPHQIAIGLVALILVPTIGNTFAGAIAVNTSNGNRVEFGQGITSAASCDPSVVITPAARYDSSTAKFYLESVTVSDIDYTDTSKCLGKTISLSIIDSTGATSNWGSGNSSVSLKVGGTASAPTTSSTLSNFTLSVGTTAGHAESSTASFRYSGSPISGSVWGDLVDKIIIQTQ